MRTRHWPLFDLVVRTPRLELRYPDDELVLAVAELAVQGVHDPASMPFGIPWTDAPPGEQERNSLQHYWLTRATWTRNDWKCPMVVLVDGNVAGAQGIHATRFALAHEFGTGSWLGLGFQGRGIGKEMRAAILHLGFAGLGAERAYTSAFHDNHSSLGVTRSLRYEPNGESWEPRRDTVDRQLKFVLSRERWETQRRDDIEIEGLEPCLELFGATTS